MKLFTIFTFSIFLAFYLTAFGGSIGQAISIIKIGFTVIFIYYYIRQKSDNVRYLIALYIVSLPIINFTKGSFFTYNIHTILLLLIIVRLWINNPNYIRHFYLKGPYLVLLTLSFVYYSLSFFFSGKYFSNLRIFELVLTAGLIPFLVQDRNIFKSTIIILCINAIIFVQLATNFGPRLMLNTTELGEELEIGGSNPISYGLPITFCLLALWSFKTLFKSKKDYILRIILIIAGSFSILLTTSRASILAFSLGLFIYYWHRKKLLGFVQIALIIVFIYGGLSYLALHNKNFEFAYQFLVERTEEHQDNLNKLSSGRLEQWVAVRDYFIENPFDFVMGFGPGSQKEIFSLISDAAHNKSSAYYSGSSFAFHALPLQLIVEIGMIGLLAFYLIFFTIMKKCYTYMKSHSQVFPFMSICAYISIGLSVSSFDVFSGLFLGVSLIPIFNKQFGYVRFSKQKNIVISPASG